MLKRTYLSPEPQAEPQAAGLSEAPQAAGLSVAPQAAGLSEEPQAEPHTVEAASFLLQPDRLESAIFVYLHLDYFLVGNIFEFSLFREFILAEKICQNKYAQNYNLVTFL
jgi:hypothetical protein